MQKRLKASWTRMDSKQFITTYTKALGPMNSYGSHVSGKSASMAIKSALIVGTELERRSPGDEE